MGVLDSRGLVDMAIGRSQRHRAARDWWIRLSGTVPGDHKRIELVESIVATDWQRTKLGTELKIGRLTEVKPKLKLQEN